MALRGLSKQSNGGAVSCGNDRIFSHQKCRHRTGFYRIFNPRSIVAEHKLSACSLIFLTTVFLLSLSGCDTATQKRPLGFAKLGKLSEFKNVEVKEIYEHALLVRQEDRGLYAMSTLCSHDLRRLKVRKEGEQPILFCDVCRSEFDGMGAVLKGPAVSPLPFFSLLVAEAQAGGPKDTLYARIGVEVSPTWRLPFPKEKEVPTAQ